MSYQSRWTTEEESRLIDELADSISTHGRIHPAFEYTAKRLGRSVQGVKNRYYNRLRHVPEHMERITEAKRTFLANNDHQGIPRGVAAIAKGAERSD